MVAIFQEGFGAGPIGAETNVPIVSILPVMMFAVLFGLSMDYNVFLLSGIHEAYNDGQPPRDSVITGMGGIGKIVLFAGLIIDHLAPPLSSNPVSRVIEGRAAIC